MTAATNDTGAKLLRAILDDPADDAVRLVYADWLEENGEPARAEFIRVQIRLAELERTPGRPADPMQLAGYLWAQHREMLVLNTVFGDGQTCDCERCLRGRERELLDVAASADWSALPAYVNEWTWRRGFVESVACSCADWLAHGPALMAMQPIMEARLTDRKPHQWGGAWHWFGARFVRGFMAGDSHLPPALFTLLRGGRADQYGIISYNDGQAAIDALSDACLMHGRTV